MTTYLVAVVDQAIGKPILHAPRLITLNGEAYQAALEFNPTPGQRVAVWRVPAHPETFIGSVEADEGVILNGERL